MRTGPKKYSEEKVAQALDMIRRGENPFRASKIAGIPRTTLIYQLEKLPNDAFATGINPIIDHIRQKIEMLAWKTRMRLMQNFYKRSRKTDEKGSSIIWRAINESPIPSVGMGSARRPGETPSSDEDLYMFREFVYSRKGNGSTEEQKTHKSQGDTRPDGLIETDAAAETGEAAAGEEG